MDIKVLLWFITRDSPMQKIPKHSCLISVGFNPVLIRFLAQTKDQNLDLHASSF
jgi:hypothetical protein